MATAYSCCYLPARRPARALPNGPQAPGTRSDSPPPLPPGARSQRGWFPAAKMLAPAPPPARRPRKPYRNVTVFRLLLVPASLCCPARILQRVQCVARSTKFVLRVGPGLLPHYRFLARKPGRLTTFALCAMCRAQHKISGHPGWLSGRPLLAAGDARRRAVACAGSPCASSRASDGSDDTAPPAAWADGGGQLRRGGGCRIGCRAPEGRWGAPWPASSPGS